MLKTSKEFDFVYKNSYKFRTEMLDICVLRANLASEFFAKFRRLPCDLVGFSVSKKVGNAVSRNLVKRRLRAICREFFSLGNSSLRADSQNLVKNNPRISANLETRPLRGAKNRIQGCRSATADFLLEAEKRGSPPKSEKAAAFWRVGGAGRGVQPFLREETNKISGNVFAESSTDSMDSATFSQGGLPRSHSLARNDKILDSSFRKCSAQNDNNVDCHDFANAKSRNDGVRRNLICIFIAKSAILQTPFATLKSIIFDALKKQVNFRQDLYKKPRTSRQKIANHNAPNRALQNPNYNPNKGAL